MNDDEFNETDAPPPQDGLAVPQTRDKQPPHPENIRRDLAYVLVGILGVMVLSTLGSFIAGWLDVAELKELSILIAPVLTLTGTAIGFYFGASDPR